MSRDAIVGTWRLVSFHGRSDEGQLRPALGENAQGLLVYTADGYMIAVLSESDRLPFRSNEFRGGTAEEALAAINSYISYSGRYEVHGDTVTHHVDMSLFPNWIGQDQVRTVSFSEGKLVLSTPTFSLSGRKWRFELHWERAK